ncbi:MAG: hypothetical protein FWG87_12915 [Defluviitaleaceae bacterium]|nr:hypothetical protein [Defluviitaleaceae bacterium]
MLVPELTNVHTSGRINPSPTNCVMDVARPQIDECAYLGTDKSVPYKLRNGRCSSPN